jgi:hypothetical protein
MGPSELLIHPNDGWRLRPLATTKPHGFIEDRRTRRHHSDGRDVKSVVADAYCEELELELLELLDPAL